MILWVLQNAFFPCDGHPLLCDLVVHAAVNGGFHWLDSPRLPSNNGRTQELELGVEPLVVLVTEANVVHHDALNANQDALRTVPLLPRIICSLQSRTLTISKLAHFF